MIIRKKSKKGFYQLTCSLHESHLKLIEEQTRSRRVTRRDIVYAALQSYFYPEDKPCFEAQLAKSLHQVAKELQALRKKNSEMEEAFLVYVKVWLSHTPEVKEPEMAERHEAMERRFERFRELLSHELGKETAA